MTKYVPADNETEGPLYQVLEVVKATSAETAACDAETATRLPNVESTYPLVAAS